MIITLQNKHNLTCVSNDIVFMYQMYIFSHVVYISLIKYWCENNKKKYNKYDPLYVKKY